MTALTPTDGEEGPSGQDGHRSRESELRIALSRHFRPLWLSESTIVEAAARGVPADFAGVTQRRPMPLVRAGFIEALLGEPDVSTALHPRGLVIRGVRIMGHLQLDGIRPQAGLSLENCAVPRGLSLEGARLRSLSLEGSRVGRVVADWAVVEGSARLDDGFRATGTVRFPGTQIGGQLSCRGARFDNPGDVALGFGRATITGDAFLDAGFHATGTVRFPGARISGDLACSRARFDNPGDVALIFDGATITGGAFLDAGFHATGTVRFLVAQIGGQLACRGARFDSPGTNALIFDGATINGSAFLDAGFHATGGVRFPGTQIGGLLSCRGARFDNPGDVALGFGRATITGDAFLDAGFHATGGVRFPGAQISGDLACSRARFDDPGDVALFAPGVQIARSAIFVGDAGGPVAIRGNVNLCGAGVADSVAVDNARLEGCHFDFSNAVITRTLTWHEVDGGDIALDLSAAKIGLLDCQDQGTLFPGVTTLRMDACEYAQIKGLPEEHKTKAWVDQWLDVIAGTRPAEEGFSPAPYRQLERVLGRSGHTSAAKRVAIARENAESASGRRSWYACAWRFVWRWGVGYGYRPERALYCLFAAYLIGSFGAWELHAHGEIVPRTQSGGNAGAVAPSFDAFVFTAYALLPLVNLGQQDVWEPATTTAQAVVLGLTIVGWFLSTLGLLAVTGLVRADRDRA